MKALSGAAMQPCGLTSHIVPIKRNGVVSAYQLRVDGGGRGKSKLFSAGKYGSPIKAKRAARGTQRELGLQPSMKRGGSRVGRLTVKSMTRVPGIRFKWVSCASGSVAYVYASWTDSRGRNRNSCYSVERHGCAGALDKAIKKRTSCGAPMPNRSALLARLYAFRRGS